MPPRIRATFYEAIIQYGVTGKEPTLPKSISGYWPIIQPVLDTSHKRYDAAKKRNKSSENNGFATYKEKEKEKENEKERDKEKEKEAADAVSGGATQQDRQDVFAQFAGEDSALLQALQDYDLMRQEKHKELTDTMRRSLCRQLDEEFHRCEWVEIVKQATMRGWMRFYPLDEPKPHQSQQRQPTAEEECRTWADWKKQGREVLHGARAAFQVLLIYASKGDGQTYKASFFPASATQPLNA